MYWMRGTDVQYPYTTGSLRDGYQRSCSRKMRGMGRRERRVGEKAWNVEVRRELIDAVHLSFHVYRGHKIKNESKEKIVLTTVHLLINYRNACPCTKGANNTPRCPSVHILGMVVDSCPLHGPDAGLFEAEILRWFSRVVELQNV